MQRKKLLILVFVLVALVQIYVPAKMVYDSEVVLEEGTAYKFRTQPIDPTDPFRGKYITLRFDIDMVEYDTTETWKRGENIYVLLTTDRLGYAAIDEISREEPFDNIDYVRAKVRYASAYSARLYIDYEFNRFYMEESKAYDAEIAYREASRDRESNTYALVHIKDGEPIIKDVLIDGVPIRELVIKNNEAAGENF